MFVEAISLVSIWTSWLTPTVLFLLLNLTIGTILVTSGFNPSKAHRHNYHDAVVNHLHHHLHHHQQHHQQQPSQITRAPSVLQRLKSINFYSYYSQQQNSSPASDPFPEPTPELKLEKVPARVKPPLQTRTRTQTQTRNQTQAQTHTWVPNLEPTPELRLKKVPARVETQAQTHTWTPNPEPTPELRLKKVPARVETQTQTQTQTHQAEAKTWAPAIEEDMVVDDEGPTLDEIYSRIKGTSSVHYQRQNSDTEPMGGELPVKLPAKMKKSASDKSAFNHFQEVNESENMATPAVEEVEKAVAAASTATGGGGTEVDARADDFINRFKKQLQLQRIESIVRYKDMITRGSGK